MWHLPSWANSFYLTRNLQWRSETPKTKIEHKLVVWNMWHLFVVYWWWRIHNKYENSNSCIFCQNSRKLLCSPFCPNGNDYNQNVSTLCLFQMRMSKEENDIRRLLFYAQSIPLYMVAFRILIYRKLFLL